MTRARILWGAGGLLCLAIIAITVGNYDHIRATMHYNPQRICDDAFRKEYDHRTENIDHFDVSLTEGCFGGWVYVPNSWGSWLTQPIGDEGGFWEAFWFPNDFQGIGPFSPNDAGHNFKKPVHIPVRVQGRGTVRFFTNTPPEQNVAIPQLFPNIARDTSRRPAPPTLSPFVKPQLADIRITYNGDPHYCGPTEAMMPSVYTHADLLFDDNKDNVVDWAQGFQGTVPVCFIVDEKGNVTNPRLLQSPGKEMEQKIIGRVQALHFRPGMSREKPVSVQVLAEVTFYNH